MKHILSCLILHNVQITTISEQRDQQLPERKLVLRPGLNPIPNPGHILVPRRTHMRIPSRQGRELARMHGSNKVTLHSQSSQSRIADFWKTTLQGFAIAAAVLFYVVFPFSLVRGYWDTDAAARDISWKVGMEKQTVLMESANWKEVEIHAVELPEIVLPKSYDDSIGLKMRVQFMMNDLKNNKK